MSGADGQSDVTSAKPSGLAAISLAARPDQCMLGVSALIKFVSIWISLSSISPTCAIGGIVKAPEASLSLSLIRARKLLKSGSSRGSITSRVLIA